MTDTQKPTPTELIARWRELASMDALANDYGVALRRCADELEAALTVWTPLTLDLACDQCAHNLSSHSSAGCLAPSGAGDGNYCRCMKRTHDDDKGRAASWA